MVARVYAWWGDHEAALAYYGNHIDTDAKSFRSEFSDDMWDPVLRRLENDPRWQAWRAKAGLSPADLARIDFHIPPG
jgi:hypothetical protein